MRQLAHIAFLQATKREHQVAKLFLVQHVEHIRLVLGFIDRLVQVEHPPLILFDSRIVTGGEEISTQKTSPGNEMMELDVPVAFQTRVRGATLSVFIDEIVDDDALELLLDIERIERDIHTLSRCACILKRLDRAARIDVFLVVVRRVDAHVDANNLVTTLTQDQCGNRRIHPAAHCDDDGLAFTIPGADVIQGQQAVCFGTVKRRQVVKSGLGRNWNVKSPGHLPKHPNN